MPALPSSTPLQNAINQGNNSLATFANQVQGYVNNTVPTPQSNLATYNPYQAYSGTPGSNPPSQYSPYPQSNLATYNPYQAYSGTPGSNPITNFSPVINVTAPTPIVNVNIPNFFDNFLNNVLPQLLHTYVPGALPILNIGDNILKAIGPIIGPTLQPFIDTNKKLIDNFAMNFDLLHKDLAAIMDKSGLNATTQAKQYADYGLAAIQEILTNANKNAATFNQPISEALKTINTNTSIQMSINEGILRRLEADEKAKTTTQNLDLKALGEEALRQILKVLSDVMKFLAEPRKTLVETMGVISEGLQDPITRSVLEQKDKLDDVINKIQTGKYNSWHEALDDFNKLAGSSWALQGLINFVILLTMPMRAILAGSEPLSTELKHLANAEHPLQLLDASTYIMYMFKNPTNTEFVYKQLHKLGLDDNNISILTSAATPILQAQQVISAQLRGLIDENTRDRILGNSGYDNESKEILTQLSQVVPPINDLISMMAHDVFSPLDRAKYRLDENYPIALTELAAKQGLSEYWARNYWAGHWQYPSPTAVFEMLHRRNSEPELKGFTSADVDEFLRLADYSPEWRAKLRAISFQPLGRIDIRRIYKAGGKDDNWLKFHYEADGYNDRDVADLIKWTKDTQLPEDESELTKIENKLQGVVENRYIAGAMNSTEATNILKYLNKSDLFIQKAIPLWDLIRSLSGLHNETQDLSIKIKNATIAAKTKGNISNIQAKRVLVSTGMSEQQAELNLHYADLQYAVALKTKAQDTYQSQYAVHNIDETEFRAGLAGYEFSSAEIDRAFLEAQLMRTNKTKKPTEKQLETWYKDGVLDDEQLQEELAGLGLSQKYVQLIYSDITKGKLQ